MYQIVVFLLCASVLEISAVSELPFKYHGYTNTNRLRVNRSPQHAVMVRGYYIDPFPQLNYPPAAMTTLVSGENLATDSYPRNKYHPVQEDQAELDVPLEEEEVQKPTPLPQMPPQKPQEDEESEISGWPFQFGRKIPSYSAFFPIMIGGHQGGQTRGSEGGYPGGATAIANSFSTGKGGVASSHATAYGDPSISTLLRNGFFKKKPIQTGHY